VSQTHIAQTRSRYCPSCDRHLREGFLPGPDGRPDATCPRCRSLERHRFFALLLGTLRPWIGEVGTLLDIAPAPQPRKRLLELEPRRYVRFDLRPARGVDLRGDITRMPIRDRSIDLLVCYHVLEHIVDDAAAIAELGRVIAADGIGIVQVPWRPGTDTDEDPDAPEEERVRRFGLADHVRYYGDDVDARLNAGGLDVVRVTPADYVGREANTWMGLGEDQSVWLVRPTPQGRTPGTWVVPTSSPLTDTLDSLVAELAKTRLERQEARRALRQAAPPR
jgi:SAM-dependent methyltransferase